MPSGVPSSSTGARPTGLRYALLSTAPEGVFQSVGFYTGDGTGDRTPIPLANMYARGVRLFTSRAHAVSLLPEVMAHVASGTLRPGEVTTRIVDWEDAPRAYLELALKLVVTR